MSPLLKAAVGIALASLLLAIEPASFASASDSSGTATLTTLYSDATPSPTPTIPQNQALAKLAALFPQVNQMGSPQVQTSSDPFSGNPLWMFQWPSQAAPGAFASVDGDTGQLVMATFPPAGKARANPLTLTAAQSLATAFLAKATGGTANLMPMAPAVTLQGAGGSLHVAYQLGWHETVEGLPVLDAGVSVQIDALTGSVTSFNDQIIPNVTFPPASQTLPADRAAAAEFAGEGLVLAYDAAGSASIVTSGGGPTTLRPVWELAPTNGAWDATTGGTAGTGEPIIGTELPQVPSVAAAPAELTATPESQQGAPISEDQARSEAEQIVQEAGFTGWTATGSGTGEITGQGVTEQLWDIQFQPPGQSQSGAPGLSVEIAQNGGQLSQLFLPEPAQSSAASGSTEVNDAQQAASVAAAFVKAVDPQELADTVAMPATKSVTQPGNDWQVRFVRLYDGIPVAQDSVVVNVDPQGRIVNYYRNWHTLTASGGTMSLLTQAAAEKALAALPVQLAYELQWTPSSPPSGTPQLQAPELVYVFRNPRNELGQVQFDAVSGQVYGADGLAFDSPSGPSASIAGSWAETPLWAFSQAGLLPAGVGPNDTVTLGPAIHALLQILPTPTFGGSSANVPPPPGPYGMDIARAVAADILPPSAANQASQASQASQTVTREELADWTVRALGYGALIGMSNKVDVKFADASQIAPTYVNAVGIAQGLGIVTGDTGDRFEPQQPVTWAQFATILMRAATRASASP